MSLNGGGFSVAFYSVMAIKFSNQADLLSVGSVGISLVCGSRKENRKKITSYMSVSILQ